MRYNRNASRFLKIIPLILFCGVIGIIISLNSADKLTIENTTEFNAIVEKTEVTESGDDLYINIYTKEPEKVLNISTGVSGKINRSDIEALQEGEVIVFRIQSNMLDGYEDDDFGNIVSIKTGRKEIMSLDDYNVFIHDSVSAARIMAMTVALVFLLIFIVSVKKEKTRISSSC